MATKYKPYPAYKDSGIPWLGDVPEHWEVKRVKYVANLQLSNVDKLSVEGQPTVRLCNYMDVYQNEKITSSISFMQATASLEQIHRLSLKQDDVLLTKDSETPNDIGVPAVVIDKLDSVVCGYHLALLRPYKNLFDGCFLMRAIQSLETRAYFEVEAVGMTRFGIGKQTIASTPTLVPSLLEQQTIATFLDRETAKIDTLIAKQEHLIELLQEKRTALISHAVTKGINLDVPMKDSGVEWLGEVPGHWGVKMLKWLSTLQRGYDLTEAEREDGPYPVVTSGGITGTHKSFMANGPGVITGRYGSTGNFFYVEENYWPHNTALFVSDFHGNNPRFVWYALQSVNFAAHSAKSAVPGIDRNDIHVIHVAVPPSEEQQLIAAFLDRETAKIDTLIQKSRQAIDLLKERRTALISAAVTGKIDVRDSV